MDGPTALLRGLRGISLEDKASSGTPLNSQELLGRYKSYHNELQEDQATRREQFKGAGPSSMLRHPRYHQRNKLVSMKDRSTADLSISHDGDYAIAVVQAFQEDHGQSSTPLIDDGEGEPIHEPQCGDKGFDNDELLKVLGVPVVNPHSRDPV